MFGLPDVAYLPSAPSYFPVLYNVVKHFIDEKTRNKIIVCGGENTNSYEHMNTL